MHPLFPSHFFSPRVNRKLYEQGFNGYRTLVLVAYNSCGEMCCINREKCHNSNSPLLFSPQVKSDCCLNNFLVSGNNTYPDINFSNFNTVKIDRYIENCDLFPDITSITKFLLKTNLCVSYEDRKHLWDSVLYCSFLPGLIDSTGDYSKTLTNNLFCIGFQYFKSILEEFKPEVIYVFDDNVANYLRNLAIDKLQFFDIDVNWSLPVHKFIYDISPKDYPESILTKIKNGSDTVNYHKLLELIKGIRGDIFRHSMIPESKNMIKLITPHVWDKQFEYYLYHHQITSQLPEEKVLLLRSIFDNLYAKGIIDSRVYLSIKPSLCYKKYMKDGIAIEIMNKLNLGKNNVGKNISYISITEYDFIRGIGVECNDEKEWRYRKKEYTSRLDIKDDRFAEIIDFIRNFPTVGSGSFKN